LASEGKAFLAAHALLVGDGPVGQLVREKTDAVQEVVDVAARVGVAGPALNDMQVAAGVLPGEGRNLYSTAIALQDALSPLAGSGQFLRGAILPALGVAILALVSFAILNIVSVRRRIRTAEERDAKQQTAILNLLDEISTLADGDLTVKATVSEEFTGTIADSINQTVDTLRGLVGTINETAVEISAAATSTAETAQAMQHASDSQALEIVEITK
jgi:twitching motility protein PilJ